MLRLLQESRVTRVQVPVWRHILPCAPPLGHTRLPLRLQSSRESVNRQGKPHYKSREALQDLKSSSLNPKSLPFHSNLFNHTLLGLLVSWSLGLGIGLRLGLGLGLGLGIGLGLGLGLGIGLGIGIGIGIGLALHKSRCGGKVSESRVTFGPREEERRTPSHGIGILCVATMLLLYGGGA